MSSSHNGIDLVFTCLMFSKVCLADDVFGHNYARFNTSTSTNVHIPGEHSVRSKLECGARCQHAHYSQESPGFTFTSDSSCYCWPTTRAVHSTHYETFLTKPGNTVMSPILFNHTLPVFHAEGGYSHQQK